MLKLSRRRMDLRKLSNYAIILNALQIMAALSVLVLAILHGSEAFSDTAEQIVLAALSSIVIFGGVVDIRDARSAHRISEESDMLEDACGQLSTLNGTLRAQRHDFLNHLQVVYSLMEMEEYNEAQTYMETVYADIQRVSRALKTSIPALNALLASKLSECEEQGVQVQVQIGSDYEGMPVPDWELCRVFSNLIDNALDAIKGTSSPSMSIETHETLGAYHFSIDNNGPQIPKDQIEKIFVEGFSTKGTGRGLGLAIVKSIIGEHGGELLLSSGTEATCFTGTIPKQKR